MGIRINKYCLWFSSWICYLFPTSTLWNVPSQTVDTFHQRILFSLANKFRFNIDTGKFYALILVVMGMTIDDGGHILSREYSIAFVAKYVTRQLLWTHSMIEWDSDTSNNSLILTSYSLRNDFCSMPYSFSHTRHVRHPLHPHGRGKSIVFSSAPRRNVLTDDDYTVKFVLHFDSCHRRTNWWRTSARSHLSSDSSPMFAF